MNELALNERQEPASKNDILELTATAKLRADKVREYFIVSFQAQQKHPPPL
ncbi:MAG: hypothetical protein ACJAQ6_001730 [Arenicella sp.]|jgi:hypothetical protein